MMIQSHESCVNHNAKSYKEINKWIEDNKGEKLCQFDIAATAVPHTHDLHQLNTEFTESLFESGIKEGECCETVSQSSLVLTQVHHHHQ